MGIAHVVVQMAVVVDVAPTISWIVAVVVAVVVAVAVLKLVVAVVLKFVVAVVEDMIVPVAEAENQRFPKSKSPFSVSQMSDN